MATFFDGSGPVLGHLAEEEGSGGLYCWPIPSTEELASQTVASVMSLLQTHELMLQPSVDALNAAPEARTYSSVTHTRTLPAPRRSPDDLKRKGGLCSGTERFPLV